MLMMCIHGQPWHHDLTPWFRLVTLVGKCFQLEAILHYEKRDREGRKLEYPENHPLQRLAPRTGVTVSWDQTWTQGFSLKYWQASVLTNTPHGAPLWACVSRTEVSYLHKFKIVIVNLTTKKSLQCTRYLRILRVCLIKSFISNQKNA